MIPSYDDLTPSIPDVDRGEVFSAAAAVVGVRDAKTSVALSKETRIADSGSRQLFAALHPAAATGADALAAIARDFSPRLERHAGGTVVLDASGLERLFGEPSVLAEHLRRAGAPRVAIARTQTAAMLLARVRGGVTVAVDDPAAALAEVPLPVLQQLDADLDAGHSGGARSTRAADAAARARRFDVLARWGLTQVGELAALPAADLSARLGRDGVGLQRLARGLDTRPLRPDPAIVRFLESFDLEWPLDTLEPLSFVFARMLEPLAAALERADRGAIAVHLTLRLTDRTTTSRTLPLPAAMRDPRVLRTLLLLDLEARPPAAAVDAVSLELDPAPARIVQFSLLERAVPSPETMATLMARLSALVGDGRCGSPTLLDTHQPDGFAMRPVAFAERRGIGAIGVSSDAAPVEQRSACVLRRFRPPIVVRVTVAHGRPAHVAIARRGMPGGKVLQAAGPWRTSGGWWEAARWNRDEWDVALDDGTVCRLFHDRDGGHWCLDGIFD